MRGGEKMIISRELAMDCPMAAKILSSSSRKKTELIVRLAEMQLKALGYSQNQFRDRADIRFVIEMMERGFISGCSVSKRARKVNAVKCARRAFDVVDGGISRTEKAGDMKRPEETTGKILPYPGTGVMKRESADKDFRDEYLEAVRSVLGDAEFDSMTKGEE